MIVPTAFAQDIRTLTIQGFGVGQTFLGLTGNIVTFLGIWISGIALALFVIGALMLILSGGKENVISNGKNLMIGSLIGLGVVLSAGLLLNMAEFFFGINLI